MDFFSADAYLFDIDGTLVNTRGAVHYFAFRNALKVVFGIDATIDGVPVHGNTDIGILRAVCRLRHVAEDEFERRLPEIVKMMSEEVTARKDEIVPEICPSIPELLAELHRRGKLMGVVTGNFEAIGWAKLEAAGMRQYFAFGSFSDCTERRADIFRDGLAEVARRLGPQATTLIVGDTPSDITAAKEVGVPIISVATGIYPREELQALGPDVCVECCTELMKSVEAKGVRLPH
jgi:phosphoglycolate phosphatase-like HAD superfamily hydrolase